MPLSMRYLRNASQGPGICKVALRAMLAMATRNLATLDWDQVRVFLAVARAGQLAGAAARLGLDVSTVSRRLDRLESDLGVHLFDRTRDGTVATAAAEAMLPAAEEMERGLARFAAAVDAVETTAEGVVRMTAAARRRRRVPGAAVGALSHPLPARRRRARRQRRLRRSHPPRSRPGAARPAPALGRSRRRQAGLDARRAAHLARVRRRAGQAGALDRRALDHLGRRSAHIPTGRWLTEHVAGVAPVLRTSHFASQLTAAAAGLGLVLAAEPFRHVHRLEPVAIARRPAPVVGRAAVRGYSGWSATARCAPCRASPRYGTSSPSTSPIRRWRRPPAASGAISPPLRRLPAPRPEPACGARARGAGALDLDAGRRVDAAAPARGAARR